MVEDKKKEINEYLETWQSDIKQGKLCLLMLDECHLLWGDLCGYVWGKSARRVEGEMTIKNRGKPIKEPEIREINNFYYNPIKKKIKPLKLAFLNI